MDSKRAFYSPHNKCGYIMEGCFKGLDVSFFLFNYILKKTITLLMYFCYYRKKKERKKENMNTILNPFLEHEILPNTSNASCFTTISFKDAKSSQ